MNIVKEELNESDLVRMNIPTRLWTVKVGEISAVPGESGMSSRDVVERYIRKISEMRKLGCGILFTGNNGTGKTSAAVCLAKEYRRRGCTALFISSVEMRRQFIERHAFDEDENWVDRVLSVDVLVIDDLGKDVKDSTGFGSGVVDEVMRSRNSKKQVTFITSNVHPVDWESRLGIRPSTMHVLKECMLPIRVVGDDKRNASAEYLKDVFFRD